MTYHTARQMTYHARTLLPHLISARQRIDERNARDKRPRAEAKGAERDCMRGRDGNLVVWLSGWPTASRLYSRAGVT